MKTGMVAAPAAALRDRAAVAQILFPVGMDHSKVTDVAPAAVLPPAVVPPTSRMSHCCVCVGLPKEVLAAAATVSMVHSPTALVTVTVEGVLVPPPELLVAELETGVI